MTSPEAAVNSRPTLRRRTALLPGWTALIAFVMLIGPPLTVTAEEALRVVVISDLNGSYGSVEYGSHVHAAIDRILELAPDLVISTGDMVAGQRRPHLTPDEVERMWNAFHATVSDRLDTAGIPFVVTPGNHDASAYRGFGQERASFAAQWSDRVPRVRFVDRHRYPFEYAFAAGDALFVALDVTTLGHLSGESMAWLGDLLDRVGGGYTHRVVFSHLPLWPFAHGREREVIGDDALQGLLEAAGVDLYLSGHHHAFYPGSKGGVTFVSQACLGAGSRRLLGTGTASPKGFTLLELGDGPARITALAGPRAESALDWSELPSAIGRGKGRLLRADLAGTARPGNTGAARAVATAVGAAR